MELDEAGEVCRLLAVVVELANRDRHLLLPGKRRGLPHEHQSLAVDVRQRLQQHAVDDAEDRAVRADAEAQRGDHGDGVSGLAAEESQRRSAQLRATVSAHEVLRASRHSSRTRSMPPKDAQRRGPGLVRGHALAYVPRGLEIEWNCSSCVELPIECCRRTTALQPPNETREHGAPPSTHTWNRSRLAGQNAADRGGHPFPLARLGLQLPRAGRGQAIEARLPIVLRAASPFRGDRAGFLEPMQGGVERSLIDAQHSCDTCWMRCEMAHPCIGPVVSVRRISRSSVPCSRSSCASAMGSCRMSTLRCAEYCRMSTRAGIAGTKCGTNDGWRAAPARQANSLLRQRISAGAYHNTNGQRRRGRARLSAYETVTAPPAGGPANRPGREFGLASSPEPSRIEERPLSRQPSRQRRLHRHPLIARRRIRHDERNPHLGSGGDRPHLVKVDRRQHVEPVRLPEPP